MRTWHRNKYPEAKQETLQNQYINIVVHKHKHMCAFYFAILNIFHVLLP